jgi:hypothetical protein
MGTVKFWSDDTKKELSEKVAQAVAYYEAKYGAAPTLCFVNPLRLKQAELMNGVPVHARRGPGKALGAGEATTPVASLAAPRKKKMNVNA